MPRNSSHRPLPSSWRLEFVDSTMDMPIVQFVKTIEEVKRLAADGAVFKTIELFDEPEYLTVGLDPKAMITPKERAAFDRFCECCEDDDADGHDVPKEVMKRLSCIGLVRPIGFGRHEITEFGQAVFNLEDV